jgi:hypothetical protein
MAKVSAKSSKREIERKVSDERKQKKNFVWVSDVVHMDGIWIVICVGVGRNFSSFFHFSPHSPYISSHIAHLTVAVGYMSMKILFIEIILFLLFHSLLSLLPNFPHFPRFSHISMSICRHEAC